MIDNIGQNNQSLTNISVQLYSSLVRQKFYTLPLPELGALAIDLSALEQFLDGYWLYNYACSLRTQLMQPNTIKSTNAVSENLNATF